MSIDSWRVREAHAVGQVLEAVIITGPRKGEIVSVDEERCAELSDEETRMLNNVLDEAIEAVDGLIARYREGIAAFDARAEAA